MQQTSKNNFRQHYRLVIWQITKIIAFLTFTEAISRYLKRSYHASFWSDYYHHYVYIPLKGLVKEQFLGNGDGRILNFLIVVLLYLGWMRLIEKKKINLRFNLSTTLLNYGKGLTLGMVSFFLILMAYYLLGHLTYHTSISLPSFIRQFALIWLFSTFTSFTEELVYRGYCLSQLARIVPLHVANVIQAILFGAAHLQNKNAGLGLFLTTTLMGLIFGYLKLRYRSLATPVGMHTSVHLCNAFSPILLFLNTSWVNVGGNLLGLVGQIYYIFLLIGLMLITKYRHQSLPEKNDTPIN